jgi:hypothetical protein
VPIDKIVAHLRRVSSGSGASWEFNADGELEGWSPDYQATASVSGGSLQVTATGTDAQIYNPSYSASTSLGLSSSNRYLHIRMRNTTGSTNATVFFITDGDQTWDGAKSKSLAIAPYSDYTDYVIDMGTVAGWLGTIRKLRIDPGDPSVNGGTYDIDSIRALDSG